MLIFNLKKEWFDKIARGEKTVEYREVKPYWRTRIFKRMPDRKTGKIKLYNYVVCRFVKGYTATALNARITKIRVVNGLNTDLHIDKPVYAIHFVLLRCDYYA